MTRRSGHKYQHSRGIIGLPSLFVAASWLAIWVLWTSVGRTVPAGHSRSSTRTFFSRPAAASPTQMDPRDIIRLQRKSDEIDAPSSAVISHYEPEPRYLERAAGGAARTGVLFEEALRKSDSKPWAYRPDWRERALFPKGRGGDAKVLVECSQRLEVNGFRLPQMVMVQLGVGKKPWQVKVRVQTDDKGRVEHVFLESGSDDELLDRRVLQAIYRGRLVTKGGRCEGTITVSFAGE